MVVSLGSRLEMFVDGQFDGLNSTVGKICREFFGFGAKFVFFWGKIPYVAIFYCLGWLVGWLMGWL